jgi:predicted alpha/beta superfamily hydrolase
MHDGQNLFDELTGYGNMTWGIMDAYEEYPELPEVIVVGIENGGEERSNELVPFEFNFAELGYSEYGEDNYGGKTDAYMSFILKTVKPYIDKEFRTFKSSKNTALMGSSFGGVCTTYAAMMYGEYFGRFAALSNAYYVIQEDLEKLAAHSSFEKVKKFYMDVGTKESSRAMDNEKYIHSNQRIYDILKNKIPSEKIRFDIIKDGVHNEPAWHKRFPQIIDYLFND